MNSYSVKKIIKERIPDAKNIVVGRDQNWSINLEWKCLITFQRYLNDGMAFWNKYKLSHPFLLPVPKGKI
jgi:hypothetical protein